MKHRKFLLPAVMAGAAIIGTAITAPVSAHHSFSMFDPAKPMRFEATVRNFQWTAPHAILWVDAPKLGNYQAGLWSLELPTSPGNLSKMGWSRTSVKPGDRVIVEINPIRDGRRSGQFKRLTIVGTGQQL
ncbi:MAG: hypothetical protein RIS85_1849, partial [Pseudomonadota bacterium]